MGFYTTNKFISQSLFYFFILGEGGPRGHEHNLYVYATLLTIYIMGFSDSVYLIKERINNMSKEIRNTINTITHLDSMKAVKVALGLSAANQDSTGKVMEVVSLLDKNLKELATKVMKLEKKIEELETKEYERDLNERPKN
jgi:prefoldin subunit 5